MVNEILPLCWAAKPLFMRGLFAAGDPLGTSDKS
jgi:hypothetical protein